MVLSRLSRHSQIGDRVFWFTLRGDRFEGKLIDWDSNVAVVLLDDGNYKYIEC